MEKDDLLRRADYVMMQVPMTPETRHFLGPREFGLVKPGVFLVNTGRGPTVDNRALHEALLLIREEGLENAWARAMRHHLALHAGGMDGAAIAIDVATVRRAVQDHGLCAEPPEKSRPEAGCRAVAASSPRTQTPKIRSFARSAFWSRYCSHSAASDR